jgi:hypothetical protein
MPRTTSTRLRWHYTTGQRFQRIVEDAVILPATANVPAGERLAVWFSVVEPWEPTANKGIIDANGVSRTLSMEETAELGGGLVRIGVSPSAAPVSWREYVRTSGIHRAHAAALAAVGRSRGSDPTLWFVSYRPVPRALWRAVDVWSDGAWVRVPFSEKD